MVYFSASCIIAIERAYWGILKFPCHPQLFSVKATQRRGPCHFSHWGFICRKHSSLCWLSSSFAAGETCLFALFVLPATSPKSCRASFSDGALTLSFPLTTFSLRTVLAFREVNVQSSLLNSFFFVQFLICMVNYWMCSFKRGMIHQSPSRGWPAGISSRGWCLCTVALAG